jgi:hypothetical protein
MSQRFAAKESGVMPLTNKSVRAAGKPRCGVTARAMAGGKNHAYARITPQIAPLNAARTAQRAVPTCKVMIQKERTYV